MKEANISIVKASELIKKYYEYHYCDMLKVVVQPKLQQNDIYMFIKLKSIVNHKKVIEKDILNEGQIKKIIMEYLEINYCLVQSISYEPYIHNLNIVYDGEYELEQKKEAKKRLLRLRGAV